MGKFEEYISSLDKKENLDPVVIASTLLELHNEEMGSAVGKIAKLETDLQDSTAAIAERDNGIRDLKAKNWDLVNSLPANKDSGPKQETEELDKDADEITFEDFYEKE